MEFSHRAPRCSGRLISATTSYTEGTHPRVFIVAAMHSIPCHVRGLHFSAMLKVKQCILHQDDTFHRLSPHDSGIEAKISLSPLEIQGSSWRYLHLFPSPYFIWKCFQQTNKQTKCPLHTFLTAPSYLHS